MLLFYLVLVDKYVPTSSGCGCNSDLPWITTLVLKKIRQKCKAWIKYPVNGLKLYMKLINHQVYRGVSQQQSLP